MTIYRMATEADLGELAQMRWDFRLEEAPGATVHDQSSFLQACAAFLRQGLREQRWGLRYAGSRTISCPAG